MIIELVQGCTCDSFTIDDKHVRDMSPEELRQVLHKIADNADIDDVTSCIESLTTGMGEYENLGHCECCGDTIAKWTWKCDEKA